MTRRLPILAMALLVVSLAGVSDGKATIDEFDQTFVLSGGRMIALHCRGRGRYTVLLEPGDGGHRTHMVALFAALSKQYRVCDYDPRNVGRSSAAPVPRMAADLTADVFDALAAAGVKGPYILFGSSMGGLLVRSYAALRDVAGFVTSNQPGTAREWRRRAYPLMSPSQRAMDAAWMAGDNTSISTPTTLAGRSIRPRHRRSRT